MHTIRRVKERLLDSFWFVPLVITLGALGLALRLVQLQQGDAAAVGPDADGARAILSTIAGSMVTLVGVTFSMTLVALTLAAGQYSSRVLRNFMRDRVTQVALGTFAGVFVYCVIVLRAVRRPEDGVGVPDLAVSVGAALAAGGIGILIYFIHHVASSIQASTIIARIADETLAAVERQFPPDEAGEPIPPRPEDLDARPWQPVVAPRSGYLEHLDVEALVAFAQARRTTVRVDRGVGAFVVEGGPLASVVWEHAPGDAEVDHIRAAFDIGRHRTAEQDCAFGLRKLVDMAMRALSPGVNDTTTAVMCVDYLSAILVRLARRPTPPSLRFEQGAHDGAPAALRVVGVEQPFGPFVDTAFDQIRAFAGANAGVLLRLLSAIESVGGATDVIDRRLVLARHVHAIAEVVERTIAAPVERVRLEARIEHVVATLRREEDPPLFAASAAQ